MSTEPHDRLRRAREQAGFKSMADASRAFGWVADSYKSHENGTRGLRVAIARVYAKAFRVGAEWLLFGRSPPRWAGTEAPPRRISTVSAPEIAWRSVARYCTQYPNAEGVDVLAERDLDVALVSGAGTFWLRLEDDAMHAPAIGSQSFARGDVVAFDLGAPIRPGDFVVALPDDSDSAVMRKAQLRSAPGEVPAYDLQPLNPDYPTLRISGTGTGRILARAIAHTKAL